MSFLMAKVMEMEQQHNKASLLTTSQVFKQQGSAKAAVVTARGVGSQVMTWQRVQVVLEVVEVVLVAAMGGGRWWMHRFARLGHVGELYCIW